MTEPTNEGWEKEMGEVLDAYHYSSQDWRDIKDFIRQLLADQRAQLAARVEGITEMLGKEQLGFYGGKLPFVVFEGKATEEEKIAIYRQGLQDFERAVIKLIQQR